MTYLSQVERYQILARNQNSDSQKNIQCSFNQLGVSVNTSNSERSCHVNLDSQSNSANPLRLTRLPQLNQDTTNCISCQTRIQRYRAIFGARITRKIRHALDDIRKPKKSIAATRSFLSDIRNFKEIQERISTFATVCAMNIRDQRTRCTRLAFLKKRINTRKPRQYSRIAKAFPRPATATLSNP